MNHRSYLVGLLVLLLLLLGGWWFWKSKQVPPAEAPVKTAPTSSANTVAPDGTPNRPNIPAGTSTMTSEEKALEQNPKVKAMEQMVAAENAQPINVYGKVVDQYGQPVIDAKVKGGTLLIIGFEHSGGEEFSTVTDTQGRFSFTGLHGARFGLGIEKAGYVYNSQLYANWWNNYKPDPDNPVIFHMWKLKGAEPMLTYSISTAIPCNGTPTSYDLLTGKKVSSGGDFVITLTRNPVNINRGQPFDWSVTLAISGGGLMEINDLYPNEAPADGYQPSITIKMSPEMQNWQAALTHSFYFKSESGQDYGRMTISIQADFQPPPTYFGADIYINPSGSRNLEFDRTKQIRLK